MAISTLNGGDPSMTEKEINERVADQIIHAGRLNGKQYRQGDWMALLDGNVVAVADNLEGALKALRSADPDPQRGMIFELGPAVIDVIW
jgi:hypothetical protein